MENNLNLKGLFSLENRTKYFAHFLSFLCVSVALVFVLFLIGGNSLNKKNREAATAKINPFESLSLEGKGIVVYDVINKRELFSKNPDEPMPLASLTKVLTALIASRKTADNEQIKITREDLEPEGDSRLVVGDTWRAKDLRDFTLITSSNDGAFALAALTESEPRFVEEMNDTASEIGLSSCKFFNEHGLDREVDLGGAYGSARDMALLFEYALKNYPEVLEATRYKNLEFQSAEKKYPAENTNMVVDKIPNIIASKTGYTDLAGGNLVVAYDAGLGRPIVVSVLGSTEEGRFNDVLQLVEASRKFISQE